MYGITASLFILGGSSFPFSLRTMKPEEEQLMKLKHNIMKHSIQLSLVGARTVGSPTRLSQQLRAAGIRGRLRSETIASCRTGDEDKVRSEPSC